jgi:hypothetical protein
MKRTRLKYPEFPGKTRDVSGKGTGDKWGGGSKDRYPESGNRPHPF